jgi:hypothetical protein
MPLNLERLAKIQAAAGDDTISDPDVRERRATPEQQAIRRARCQTWQAILDPLTGRPKIQQYQCGYHDCQYCGAAWAHKLSLRVWLTMTEGYLNRDAVVMQPLYMYRGTRAEIQAICDLHKRDQYLRLPQKEDEDVLFVTDELRDASATKLSTSEQVDALPWFALQMGVPGRNISGNLGKQASAPMQNPVKVTIGIVSISASGQEPAQQYQALREAYEKATLDSFDLTPTDATSLQLCIQTRERIARRRLNEKGYFVTVHYISKRVDMSKLDWYWNTQADLPMLYRRGYSNALHLIDHRDTKQAQIIQREFDTLLLLQ